ncbi:MAG: DNA repair protein RecN [Acidobacteriota bacterium]
MLNYLRVENFAVVEKVELNFCPTLNILTGETGAGKSILIDAIKLFLDKKIPPNCIRDKSKKLTVEAFFENKEEEFVLRREISDGTKKRSNVYINGELVPFINLKEKAEKLLNIYGQNEYLYLLSPSNHMEYFDRYSGNGEILTRLSGIYDKTVKISSELDELKEKENAAVERLEFINFQITEIKDLDLEEQSEGELEQELKILSSAEDILKNSNNIINNFYRGDNSVYSNIAETQSSIEYLKGIFPEFLPLSEEINKFYKSIPEISSQLTDLSRNVDYNEADLNKLEEKLFKIKRLKAKYGVDFEGLKEKYNKLLNDKNLYSNMEFSIKEKKKELDKTLEEYKKVNKELRKRRLEKGKQLNELVETELTKLEMKKSQFVVNTEEKEPDINNITPKGSDSVEFLFSSNPGLAPGKIKNIASGGELSRLMLVLKSTIRDDSELSYIFDEVDSGIGGKTADFVGFKLRDISRNNQVICISHLPQIASFADRHFLVGKEFREDITFSYVNEISAEERETEIARLMAGTSVTSEVLEAAKKLLESKR